MMDVKGNRREPLSGASDGVLTPMMPRFARRVLLAAKAPAVAAALPGADVYGATPLAPQYDILLLYPDAPVDESVLAELCGRLSEESMIFVSCDPVLGAWEGTMHRRLAALEFKGYEARHPRRATRYTLVEAHRKSEDPALGLGTWHVRGAYDPLEHGRRLMNGGQPDQAFEVLDWIPEALLEDPVYLLQVLLEMQLALLAMKEEGAAADLLTRFFWAQEAFYRIMNLQRGCKGAFLCQAMFWRRLHRPDMARRLLRSLSWAHPDPQVEALLEVIPDRAISAPALRSPEAAPSSFSPRILIIGHDNADCGMDALYDGLCRVLGDERVTEYPWKAHYHGAALHDDLRHPCASSHQGARQRAEQLSEALAQGAFDCIFYADPLELTSEEDVLRLTAANPKTPIFLFDVQDQGFNVFERMMTRIRRERVHGRFKREMLIGQDYGPDAWPLNLTCLNPPQTLEEGPRSVSPPFWAGHRSLGLRRLCLDDIEGRRGWRFPLLLSAADYRRGLLETQVGLDFFGLGFDTVRYWEIPAHGAMLLAERRPILVPNNFEEGREAMFFDDLPDLMAKLEYCESHPDEAARIARAGRERFLQDHTVVARAAYVLAQVYGRLCADLS